MFCGDALRAGKNQFCCRSSYWSKIRSTTRPIKLDYHGGEKFPHLVRDESKPDLLSDIIKPASQVWGGHSVRRFEVDFDLLCFCSCFVCFASMPVPICIRIQIQRRLTSVRPTRH